MRKGFTFTRFLANSLPSLKLALVVPAAVLWSSTTLAQAQTQIRSWEDEFQNRSRIASAANVRIDTTLGEISLLSIPDSLSTTGSFRLALKGIDQTFMLPKGFTLSEVADIDSIPGLDNVYLVTDSKNRQVFSFDAADGTSSLNYITDHTFVFRPVDAFSYREMNERKILVTDAEGKVIKINIARPNVIEWPKSPGTRLYESPSAAVVVPHRNEVLICETGKNHLIAVDTTNDATTWEFDGGATKFNKPVDVEVVPSDSLVYLVTDQGNHRVVLVQRSGATGQIIFQFGKTGVPGSDSTSLNTPTDAAALPNGNIVICDSTNNRLIEVTRQGKIVYTFAHPLYGLKSVYRIPTGPQAHKTLVASRATPTAVDILPRRLSYRSNTNNPFISSPTLQFGPPPRGREVDFDFLRWRGFIPSGGTTPTRIRLKIRTVKDLSDTTRAEWYGPTSQDDFYTDTLTAINPVHDGDIFFQFQAYLDTDSLSPNDLTFRLRTPILNSVSVSAHYFRPTPPGSVTSTVIKDSSNIIITAWRSLEFETDFSPAQGHSVLVDVLDSTGTRLHRVPASGPLTRVPIDPFSVPNLRGKQALQLRATLQTGDPTTFTSPKLLRWAVDWNYVRLGPAQVRLTDAASARVNEYRLRGIVGDSVYASVVDPNVLPLRDSVAVTIISAKSTDTLRTFLKVNPVTREAFRARPPFALVFLGAAETANRSNRRLEVVDRDTLHLSYVDPLDASDRGQAAALVVRRVFGTLTATDFSGTKIDSISINDSLYVSLAGETDQNNSPTVPDTVSAIAFNPSTNDRETITLVETGPSTGNFRSLNGLLISGEGTSLGNGRLSVVAGSNVTVSYIDPNFPNETATTTSVGVRVPPDGIVTMNEAFLFAIAPNPYRARQHRQLNIRARVRTGDMTIRQIEIYNLAGEKVRTLTGAQTRLGTNATISANQGLVDSKGWWNIQGDDGVTVASGTYFAKIYVRLINQASGRDEEASVLRKFVIIQ